MICLVFGGGATAMELEAVTSALIYFLPKDADSSPLSLVDTFIFTCASFAAMIPLGRRSGTAFRVGILWAPEFSGCAALWMAALLASSLEVPA